MKAVSIAGLLTLSCALGCASTLPVVASGTAGSANVRDTGARPTPEVFADAIERDGSVRGLIDPQRGLVVVRAYVDEHGEVRQANRQCSAELVRTVRSIDTHLDVDDERLHCNADTCKDPSRSLDDPHRLFVFRPDSQRGLVLEAVLFVGDAALSEPGLEVELEWARAQIDPARDEPCSD